MDDIAKAVEAARAKQPLLECRLDESMKAHTSFRIGAPLRAMFFPGKTRELTQICELLHGFGIEPLIFGNGTNLLVDDSKPLEMIAVKTTGICGAVRTGEDEITADAGILLSKLAAYACGCGLSGLEFVHGIPGSLGGAVTMNAGAYGMEIKDIIQSTKAFSYSDGIYEVAGGEHEFSYRRSRFSDKGDVILSSVVSLQKDDKESIEAKMDELYTRRCDSQPLKLPSAGSTFKRPKDGYAAALIEQAGLKGFSIGGAEVSAKHSGFVVNNGTATFADIMAVIEHVREEVFKRTGIELELENRIVK